jgi:hypothetical protein
VAGQIAKLLTLFLISSCVTRTTVNAKLWKNNFPIPERFCTANPELRLYGIARKLNNGKVELMSICNPATREFSSMDNESLKAILNGLVN